MATDPDVARAARNLITEHGAVAEAIALARAKHTEGKATGQRWPAHAASTPVLVAHVRRGMPGERIVYRPLDPGIAAHVLEAMAPRMRWSFPRVSNALFPHPS